jgi:hypothetical protein
VLPLYWDKFLHRFTSTVHSALYTVLRGAKAPSTLRWSSPAYTSRSLSLLSGPYRRAKFTPYGQCGLLAFPNGLSDHTFLPDSRLDSTRTKCLSPGPWLRKMPDIFGIRQYHRHTGASPSLPFSSQNLSLFPRVFYLGFFDRSDQFLARPTVISPGRQNLP